jgi:hypothetical protein
LDLMTDQADPSALAIQATCYLRQRSAAGRYRRAVREARLTDVAIFIGVERRCAGF